MAAQRTAPDWLLAETGLLDGIVSEDGTSVTGKPKPALSEFLQRGLGGSSERLTVNLAHLSDGKAMQRRLADEGVIHL